ncbi:hypothetical protein [Acrocarpospora catenulata]|uniref:hypothetical protein n=1 Tax=Acrocarpospora catenulata TaxID=2836182 RepID=UPI001BDAD38B|nr:hypothetical protein [Acrocarpospora catenulata]
MASIADGSAATTDEKPRGWLRGRLFLFVTALVALIGWYYASVPYPYFEQSVFALLAWTVITLAWIVRLLVAAFRNKRIAALNWLLVPVIFVVYVTVHYTEAPFWVRFKLSESSLERYAIDLARGDQKYGCEWVGLYYVCGAYDSQWGGFVSGGAEAIPGGAQVMVTDWPLMVSRGFLWLPDGRQPPDEVWCEEYRHLSGPWWACRSWDGV